MKKLKYIFFALIFVGLWSCEDDDANIDILPSETIATNAIINTPEETEFTVIETTENVTGNEDETATAFTWSAAKGSYGGLIVYTLQLDLKGNNFRNAAYLPLSEQKTSDIKQEVTFGDLNLTVNQVNTNRVTDGAANPIDFSIPNDYEVRVISASNVSGNLKYSESITVSIKAYEEIIVIEPELFVVGSVQGYYGAANWTPTEAIQMRYIGDGTTKVFEAYVKASSSDILKFISNQADWANVVGNYGDDGTNSGILINSGESKNISFESNGLYYIQVDIDNLTYKTVKMQWGIIGNATAGGWSDETPMTYDIASNTWKITANLDAGELKFRSKNTGAEIYANDWAFNCGPDLFAYDIPNSPNFQMGAGSATITITIDLDGAVTTTGV
ncbi:hypothetical protein EC396_02425 [Lutibacter sp. HS1-25]|uniref:SusE domain-containing protein n=1 Tax=Lutibacter sp. HS1-25 TaxID=2485000 RepID=UPI001012A27D|nr:SusE domain-containing protein [Lutibacter sp. HS1-25]RXP63302.1 hypothetical protein EC396_02425 [Lutibacter sp. HS1-25]